MTSVTKIGDKDMISPYTCIFVYCLTMLTPAKQCTYVIEQPDENNTGKMVDVVTQGGKAQSVCGPKIYVESSDLYKEVVK